MIMLFKILNLSAPYLTCSGMVHFSGVYYYDSISKDFYIQNHNGIFRYIHNSYSYSGDVKQEIIYRIRYKIEIIDKEFTTLSPDMNFQTLNEILSNRVEHLIFDLI